MCYLWFICCFVVTTIVLHTSVAIISWLLKERCICTVARLDRDVSQTCSCLLINAVPYWKPGQVILKSSSLSSTSFKSSLGGRAHLPTDKRLVFLTLMMLNELENFRGCWWRHQSGQTGSEVFKCTHSLIGRTGQQDKGNTAGGGSQSTYHSDLKDTSSA